MTALKKKLTEKLNPFLAGHAEVYFDDRIEPGVYFKQEIQQKLRNTQIFVAVVSPSYLDSDFCIADELDWFQNQGGKQIIQLLKVPLEEGQEVPLPKSHYKVLHDETDGHLLDGEPLEKILDELVAAMTKRLREFWKLRPKIYVAQLRNENLKPRWDKLKDQLHTEGYAVLPKGVLPMRVPDSRIREWLEAARLSVHLASVLDDPLAQRQLAIAQTNRTPRPPTALSPLLRISFLRSSPKCKHSLSRTANPLSTSSTTTTPTTSESPLSPTSSASRPAAKSSSPKPAKNITSSVFS